MHFLERVLRQFEHMIARIFLMLLSNDLSTLDVFVLLDMGCGFENTLDPSHSKEHSFNQPSQEYLLQLRQ